MEWNFLRSIFVGLIFVAVSVAVMDDLDDDLDHDPQVVIDCEKPTLHVDINTGDWVADKNNTSLCTADKGEILRYCQAVYPSKDISNIVEANKRVLVDNSLVTPYRCLVGSFESDALLVPPKCRFEHMHENNECQTHDAWRSRASEKCQRDALILNDYGVLIPCGTGMFTGVEFVCCPPGDSHPVTEAVQETETTPQPTSVLEHLKSEISKFAKYVEPNSVGCDRKKYHDLRDNLDEVHREKVETLIKKWQEAEQRYKLLKASDEDQATNSMTEELENFKNTLNNYDDQAKLERARLKEEHHQCTQIDLNNKKNKALRDFVAALQEEPRDGNKILEAIQRYVKFCTQDRLHNLRYFEYVQKHNQEKADEARGSLQNHFKAMNKLVNESMILLYKLPEVARQFQLDLPDWIPKHPALPTEKPTPEKSSSAKDPTDPPSRTEDPTDERHKTDVDEDVAENEIGNQKTSALKKAAVKLVANTKTDDPENVNEDERHLIPTHSQATFSAIIGLSCGALLIMIIIVVAMAMRRTRPNNRTKTVLVDGDSDTASEKSHLINMQENGYENPTYKFYDY